MGWTTQTSTDAASTELVINWMDGQPAPSAVLELLVCKCKKTCKLPSCVCMNSGLRCTDLCTNQPAQDDSSNIIDNEADEYDDDDF